MKEKTIHAHLKAEKDARMLRECVGSFVEFVEHREGALIAKRIPPKVGTRFLAYIEDFKRLVK